jgi:hypothetical protein
VALQKRGSEVKLFRHNQNLQHLKFNSYGDGEINFKEWEWFYVY